MNFPCSLTNVYRHLHSDSYVFNILHMKSINIWPMRISQETLTIFRGWLLKCCYSTILRPLINTLVPLAESWLFSSLLILALEQLRCNLIVQLLTIFFIFEEYQIFTVTIYLPSHSAWASHLPPFSSRQNPTFRQALPFSSIFSLPPCSLSTLYIYHISHHRFWQHNIFSEGLSS